MIEATTVLLMLLGFLSLFFAVLVGVIHLAIRTDPRPPKAGLMSELYRGPK